MYFYRIAQTLKDIGFPKEYAFSRYNNIKVKKLINHIINNEIPVTFLAGKPEVLMYTACRFARICILNNKTVEIITMEDIEEREGKFFTIVTDAYNCTDRDFPKLKGLILSKIFQSKPIFLFTLTTNDTERLASYFKDDFGDRILIANTFNIEIQGVSNEHS